MKKMCKKVLTFMLAAASVLSFSSLAANASEVHKYEYTTVSDAANNNYFYCYLHYYYDSANQNILTKVAAISDFNCGNGAALVTTPAYQPVYLYNSADVTYANGDTARCIYRSDPIYLTSSAHVGESQMYTSPLMLNTALRTGSVVSEHGLSTYVANQHSSSESTTTSVYPKAGESQIYLVSQRWQ